jgi:hypothetical protein
MTQGTFISVTDSDPRSSNVLYLLYILQCTVSKALSNITEKEEEHTVYLSRKL